MVDKGVRVLWLIWWKVNQEYFRVINSVKKMFEIMFGVL